MKKFIAIILILAMSAICAVCASACSNKDGLTIGITIYSPMNYYDEDGELIGFDTEFAQKACEELGYTPKFQVINWDNKIFELQSGQIDLIWNGMTVTDELKEQIAVSDPYLENKQVVVVKSQNAANYSTVADILNASSIAVESGSAGESVCAEAGYTSLNKMEAQSDCLLEVKAGRSDAAVIDLTMAKAMTGDGTDFSGLTYVDVGFEGEEYGIGARKEDGDLLSKLNGLIAKYKTDGTFDSLVKKYMA